MGELTDLERENGSTYIHHSFRWVFFKRSNLHDNDLLKFNIHPFSLTLVSHCCYWAEFSPPLPTHQPHGSQQSQSLGWYLELERRLRLRPDWDLTENTNLTILPPGAGRGHGWLGDFLSDHNGEVENPSISPGQSRLDITGNIYSTSSWCFRDL